MSYASFHLLEDKYQICTLFNNIMLQMQPFRHGCTPASLKPSSDRKNDAMFCDFCRYETWMHECVERLVEWTEIIDEYFDDFCGSWKYYAASKRIECLREDGEEESVILKEGLKDSELQVYSVISDLYDEGCVDIVQDTMPDDLNGFCGDIIALASVDIFAGLRQHFGSNVIPYMIGDDGEPHRMTIDDCNLDMVSRKVDAEDNVTRIKAIGGGIVGIISIIRSCRYNEDNTERMQMVRTAAKAMLELDFKRLGGIVKDFRERYSQYDV